ncbi:hypothetical protein ABKV19_002596 [Rosa sericea]
MGIKGADALFDQLGPTVLKDIRLDQLDLSGKKVGIDATLWLGTVKSMLKADQKKLSSSTEKFLVKDQQKTHADHFIAYCEDKFKLLNRLKIKSMMVFDGNATPRKTEIFAIRVRLTLFSSFAFLDSLKFRRNQKVNSVFAIQRKKENPIPNNSDRLLQLTRWWKRFCWHGVIERGRRGIEIGGVGKFEGLIRNTFSISKAKIVNF